MNPFNRVFWRPGVADEVREELAFHIDMRVQGSTLATRPPFALF